MATTYTAVSTNGHTKNLSLPNDGDADAVASVNTSFEALADNDAWMIESYRTVPMTSVNITSFDIITVTNGMYYQQNNVSSQGQIWFGLNLPAGTILDGAIVTVSSDTGHASLPATMPSFDIVSTNGTSNTIVDGPTTDSSASVGAYETEHTIESTGAGHTIDEGNAYYVRVQGETGANSVVDKFRVHAIAVRVLMP